jgi:hypothetical protein
VVADRFSEHRFAKRRRDRNKVFRRVGFERADETDSDFVVEFEIFERYLRSEVSEDAGVVGSLDDLCELNGALHI